MKSKLWPANAIKNHIFAIHSGIRAGLSPTLLPHDDDRPDAYWQGVEAVLTYLAERFGFSLKDIHYPQTKGTDQLRAWTREEIQIILDEVQLVMNQSAAFHDRSNPLVIAYYDGIAKTVQAVALSFGIEISDILLKSYCQSLS